MQQLPDPAADQLIADQYADRPQLRPVLDAVLAAVPTLGPVTVQARKTFVSLVSPRPRSSTTRPSGGCSARMR